MKILRLLSRLEDYQTLRSDITKTVTQVIANFTPPHKITTDNYSWTRHPWENPRMKEWGSTIENKTDPLEGSEKQLHTNWIVPPSTAPEPTVPPVEDNPG